MTALLEDSLHQLRRQLKGDAICPADSEYDEARKIWNAMIDRHPAVIVQCKNTNDALLALEFAKEYSLEITIRGAGHNIGGNAIDDDGCMIDFSQMKI